VKVVLVSPYAIIGSYGPRVLSACLKRAGHEVTLVFLPHPFDRRYDEQVMARLVELARGAGLVGVSLMSNLFSNAVQITDRIRAELDVRIVWGGVHPTVCPEESLDHADFACVGEGEESLVELADAIEGGGQLHSIPGMWCREGDGIVDNGFRMTGDLDSLPFPDYDDEGHFVLDAGELKKMDGNLLHRHLDGCIWTESSRGCPFSCSFCVNEAFNLRRPGGVRMRSVGMVVDECVEMRRRYPQAEWTNFMDDAFLSRRLDRIEEFAADYKRRVGLRMSIVGAHPLMVSREKIALLADAGLFRVRMGIQSGSDRVRRTYGRFHTNDDVRRAAGILSELIPPAGRILEYDIIISNPWETEAETIETFRLLMTLPRPFRLSLFSMHFYPGTTLHQKAKREGLIRNELAEVYDRCYFDHAETPLNAFALRLRECLKEDDAEALGVLAGELDEYEKGLR
jgi:radical SAM superfamily enzyme YgiQ (UPF0313 family)